PEEYVESAEVAIVFPRKPRVYGSTAQAPSELQKISCIPLELGTRCTMGPLKAGQGSFKVTLSTDVEQAPMAQMVARNFFAMTVTVKNRSSLTVPTEVQRRAGFKPGDRLELALSCTTPNAAAPSRISEMRTRGPPPAKRAGRPTHCRT